MKFNCVLISLLVTTAIQASAIDVQSKVTARFSEIATDVTKILAGSKPSETLVVFDIDNTILKTATDFGSEHWFLWQKKLLDQGIKELPLVAHSMEDLLRVQAWIYQIGRMQPTAAEIPQEIAAFRSAGAQVVALTSRVLAARDASLKEMTLNQIQLSTAKELGLKIPIQAELAYDLQNLSESGLILQDVTEFKLGPAQKVAFENGVFFTQGQHKGIMLKILLHRTSRNFKNIIFVDDRPHHIQGMRDAFKTRPEQLYTYQYIYAQQWIDAFNSSQKQAVQKAWCYFSRGLLQAKILDSKKDNLNYCN